MLTECFPGLGGSKVLKELRAFLHSWVFIALVVLLMVCSNLFSLELPVFDLYLLFGFLIVLFDDDLKGILPIALCCYMAISFENNPAINVETSLFYDPRFLVHLIFIIAVACALLLARLVVLLVCGERKKVPLLAVGFGALGLSFVLGGLFSRYYDFRTAFFGFVVILSLCGLYFLFYYGVDWKKTDGKYWAIVFCAIGCGLLIELLGVYLKYDKAVEAQGAGHDFRHYLQTGWGMYNNIGCAVAMCLPATLYLAAKLRHGWAFTLLACAQGVGLLFTQSRSSILFGGVVAIAALVIMLVKCPKEERKFHFAVIGGALIVAAVVAVAMWGKISEVFRSMIDMTFSKDPANARGPIYAEGLRHFCSAPFFGVGFYQCTANRWGFLPETAFMPPRYHNTVIQLMASGGIFALCCYLMHRLETLFLLFRRPALEKTFIALAIAPLLLTSLVECHFFSFGPGMLYGVLLVCAEGFDESRGDKTPTDSPRTE